MQRSVYSAGLLLWLMACPQNDLDPISTWDSGQNSDTDAESDTDTDTDEGTDEDGDGFTVEEGDCDDNDIGVNPAREEDPSDGKDNDCDGRVDEEWSGLIASLQSESGNSSIVHFDTVGRITDEVVLDPGFMPFHIDHGIDGGYVMVHHPEYINISSMAPSEAPTESAAVVQVDADGTCTVLAEFQDENFWWGPYVRGVKTHPDGYYVVAGPGALYRVDPDGTTTTLAEWAWDWNDPKKFQMYAMDVAIDPATGTVGLIDLLGGIATWTEESGLVMLRQADLSGKWKNWDAMVGQGISHMDGGGWYGFMINWETQEYALYRYNANEGSWTIKMEWVDSNLVPLGFTTDGDHGEYYATAKGGDHRTIWRIREAGELIDDFYDEVEDGYNLWGIASIY